MRIQKMIPAKAMRIWTIEGLKPISKGFFLKGNIKGYKILTEQNELFIPFFYRVKTPRGYILPQNLNPKYDALYIHTEKNLTVLRTLETVEELTIKEFLVLFLEDNPVVRSYSLKDNNEYYVCLNEEGMKTKKKLKDIKENDMVQVGDEFKEVICKKEINDEEGIIVINMNNNGYFINDFYVLLDKQNFNLFIKKELQ